jgi:cyclic pyranopterin monophosphate synthase
MNTPFSHLDSQGHARMVDVSHKPVQHRKAVASGCLDCSPDTIRALREQALPKGDVLAVARVAGIQGAKRTADLIPLCHPLSLSQVSVEFDVADSRITITASVVTDGRTGVEMEALTAVSIAALTLYDMMKAVDKNMRIGEIAVLSKEKQ